MERLIFTINLNKFGDEKKLQKIENNTFIGILVVFVVLTLAFSGFVYYMNNTLNQKIANRKNLLTDIENEIAKYRKSGEYLSSKDLQRLSKISTERIFWTRKLVALSEKTHDKIAITHFSFKRGVLSLYGITKVDKKEKEFDLIDQFIESLRNNKQISSDFPEIKFVKSRRDKEKDTDILRFQIDCIGKDYETEEQS